jgi:hypothetical protein
MNNKGETYSKDLTVTFWPFRITGCISVSHPAVSIHGTRIYVNATCWSMFVMNADFSMCIYTCRIYMEAVTVRKTPSALNFWSATSSRPPDGTVYVANTETSYGQHGISYQDTQCQCLIIVLSSCFPVYTHHSTPKQHMCSYTIIQFYASIFQQISTISKNIMIRELLSHIEHILEFNVLHISSIYRRNFRCFRCFQHPQRTLILLFEIKSVVNFTLRVPAMKRQLGIEWRYRGCMI